MSTTSLKLQRKMKKNRFNLILSALLTLTALAIGQNARAQGPATIGSISYNNTLGAYEIANENNLKDLAVYVNGSGSYTTGGDAETTAHDCTGLTFKVTGNIALTHITDWNDALSTEDTYTPIGTNTALFKGTFDGQGKTISGLRIYKTSSPAYLNLGLFGYTGEGGSVKDVYLTDVRISGGNRLGGIVGTNILGTVSGCRIANAFIEGKEDLGGIIGQNKGTVSDCHTAQTVTIHAKYNYAKNLGGIAGYLGSSDATNVASIIGCTSAVTLTINDGVVRRENFGGIVGRSSGYSKNNVILLKVRVENCIAIGATVPEVRSESGLSHLYGAVVGLPKGTIFINDYYLNCTIAGTPNATGVGYMAQEGDNSGLNDIQSLHSITLQAGFTASGGVAVGSDTYYAANSTVTLAGSTGYTVTIDGTDPAQVVTVKENAGVYTFTMPAGNVTVSGPPDYAGLWHADDNHDGSSEEKAYIITTAAGLSLLSGEVNTGNNQEGKFFKLGNDIIFTHNTDWNDATSTENNYIAIGRPGSVFKGTFDGCGYTVSGIRIYKGGSDNVADSNLGLFGFMVGGHVKNVKLADARITGFEDVGGIVGVNNNGAISGCTVADDVCIHAVVSSSARHGGIVGLNQSLTAPASVTNCTSSAQLTIKDGLDNVGRMGGIVGWNTQETTSRISVVSDCLVLNATIMRSDGYNNYIGAIAGYNLGFFNANAIAGTLSKNYYFNCTVGNATATANTNVGVGSSGSGPSDETTEDGARGIGLLTLGTGVSVSAGTTVVVRGTTYYYSGQDITLGHDAAPAGYSTFSGYVVKDAQDSDITATVLSESTLTMPAIDLTVTATWTAAPSLSLTANAATVMGEAKYVTTFYHGTLDYQLPAGALAYMVKKAGDKLEFYRIGKESNVIPKGTPVMIVVDKTAADDGATKAVSLTKLDATAVTADAGKNDLLGSDTPVDNSTGDKYVLGISGGVLNFYKLDNSISVPAGKAYMN